MDQLRSDPAVRKKMLKALCGSVTQEEGTLASLVSGPSPRQPRALRSLPHAQRRWVLRGGGSGKRQDLRRKFAWLDESVIRDGAPLPHLTLTLTQTLTQWECEADD